MPCGRKNQAYDKDYQNPLEKTNKHTEEPEAAVLPSLVSATGAGKACKGQPQKKVVPHIAELHKVNIPMEPSQRMLPLW